MINTECIDSMYHEFRIAKGNGKFRHICAPCKELKSEQRRILDEELSSIRVHECAYGFVSDRNIFDNAVQHIGSNDILTMDLRDFFDTITREQVLDALKQNGMDEEKAQYISKVCTCKGVLPQGAPTSPTLSNIVAKPVDKKLYTICKVVGVKYTRYADDLTFSGEYETLLKLKNEVVSIIQKYGWKVAGSKTHTIGKHLSQNVTGVVINQSTSVSQAMVDKFRMALHCAELDIDKGIINSFEELAKQHASWATFHGYTNFLSQTNPKYKPYMEQVQRVRKKLKAIEKNETGC